MQLSQAIEGFVLSRTADGISQSTLAIYRHFLRLLTRYLDDPDCAAITEQQIIAFAAWLQTDYVPTRPGGKQHPLSPSSISNAWSATRSFFAWAEQRLGLARLDLVWKRPRVFQEAIQPFSQEDVQRLLAATQYTATAKTERRRAFKTKRPTALRDRAILLLLLDTGIRAGECARLLVGDLDFATGDVAIRRFGTGRKTHGRHVRVSARTAAALWDYLSQRPTPRPDDPLFLSTRTKRALDRNRLANLIEDLGARAGVSDAHPHRLRHTFAIEYLRNGGDIYTLQSLLGHSELDMVKRYLALARADLADAHRRASPVDRWRL